VDYVREPDFQELLGPRRWRLHQRKMHRAHRLAESEYALLDAEFWGGQLGNIMFFNVPVLRNFRGERRI